MKNKLDLIQSIFAALFTFLVISYTFFDDGGITTKTGYDFLFIPIVSFVIAAIFTLIIGAILSLAKLLLVRLK